MSDLFEQRIPSTDPRLNRQIVHDPQSRGFAVDVSADSSLWRTRRIRIHDPRPNPDQTVGNCTTCAKGMQFNARGNRRIGVVLDMDWALAEYELETRIDPFPGYFMPGDPNSQDTGSNGLSSCKAAQQSGDGDAYSWFFGGIDQIVTYLMRPDAIPVSVGTRWYQGMFDTSNPDPASGVPMIEPTGAVAGGHQYIYRGYDEALDMLVGRCWWGPGFQDFLIARPQAGELLADKGDAHIQVRLQA